MTKAECQVLSNQQGSLIKYIRRQSSVMDYVAYAPKEECGYCVPRGVIVACDYATLAMLRAHADRYYPNMTVLPMTEEQYNYRSVRNFCSMR